MPKGAPAGPRLGEFLPPPPLPLSWEPGEGGMESSVRTVWTGPSAWGPGAEGGLPFVMLAWVGSQDAVQAQLTRALGTTLPGW